MNRKRVTDIALGVLYGLVAYPVLAYQLWMRDAPVDFFEILKDGGLYFFATAATGPLFFAKIVYGSRPRGALAIPFFAIPVLVLAITISNYGGNVADSLGVAKMSAMNATKFVWMGVTVAACAVGYRCGFEPRKI